MVRLQLIHRHLGMMRALKTNNMIPLSKSKWWLIWSLKCQDDYFQAIVSPQESPL
jgi:hypothetical protein